MVKVLDAPATLTLINAAKAWERRDEENSEEREKRLAKAVVRYVDLEDERKARNKKRSVHNAAEKAKTWIAADGKETAYVDLEGKHLYNIRKTIAVDSGHHDGICEEISRRAGLAGIGIIWAEGIPFVWEKIVRNGDQPKISFRNILTRQLQHIEVDRSGFVVAWSSFRGHGLSRNQAFALYEGAPDSTKNLT